MKRLAVRARSLFRRHINQVVANIGESVVKNFVRGEGCYVWDDAGTRYLDFVAGYGSVNLGHNHPAITTALEQALAHCSPGFAPSSVNPFAAELAELLVAVSPPEQGT